MSDTNQGLMIGSTIPRVNLMELQIPMLDLAESAELGNLLQALERSEAKGHELARRANELRAALVGAVATAVVRVQADSEDGDA